MKNKYIDHTILKATATKNDIEKLCDEAIKYNFKSVCVNPYYVSYAKKLLKNSDVLVCTVVGFPLGANTSYIKGIETKDAINNGADEIDMVINIGAAILNDFDTVKNDIKEVIDNANGKLVKVILETCYLSEEVIKKVSTIASDLGADFVKTSTGFGTRGASINDILLMKSAIKEKTLIKASGGIRCKDDMEKMIDAGASRIGTSNSTTIMDEYKG